jgi:hypothetical protein
MRPGENDDEEELEEHLKDQHPHPVAVKATTTPMTAETVSEYGTPVESKAEVGKDEANVESKANGHDGKENDDFTDKSGDGNEKKNDVCSSDVATSKDDVESKVDEPKTIPDISKDSEEKVS